MTTKYKSEWKDNADWLRLSDVMTLWTWKGSDLPELDANIQKFLNKI